MRRLFAERPVVRLVQVVTADVADPQGFTTINVHLGISTLSKRARVEVTVVATAKVRQAAAYFEEQNAQLAAQREENEAEQARPAELEALRLHMRLSMYLWTHYFTRKECDMSESACCSPIWSSSPICLPKPSSTESNKNRARFSSRQPRSRC